MTTAPSRIQRIVTELDGDLHFLAGDIINSQISPFIRISELITMLMKNVEIYRGLSGNEKKEIVIQLGLQFILKYAPEADRIALESLFKEDAKDIIELIISTTHIVNQPSIKRLIAACLPCLI